MMNFIRETEYARDMETVVLPYLQERKTDGDFQRIAGQKIHYRFFTADVPRAQLVLVHGFSEGIDKYNELIYYFLQAGFHVWQIQQRGHGQSWRAVKDPSLVYIRDYRELVEDLHYFVAEIVKKHPHSSALPRYIYGHSMGGGVTAVYLESYPDDFQKAVLSSPMLELNTGGTPLWLASALVHTMIALGKGREYMTGSKPFCPEPDFENSCSNSKARYDYWFKQTVERTEYQTCALAYQTVLEFQRLTRAARRPDNCSKVQAEVLLFQAGRDTLVKPEGQETFIRQIGSKGKLVRVDDAKHEIYMSNDQELQEYWQQIEQFLN